MQTLRPDLKLFIHQVKCCTHLTAPARDARGHAARVYFRLDASGGVK